MHYNEFKASMKLKTEDNLETAAILNGVTGTAVVYGDGSAVFHKDKTSWGQTVRADALEILHDQPTPVVPKAAKTKLFRNLKPGEKFVVETGYGVKQHYSSVVTVSCVRETCLSWLTGKRQWNVFGNFPWWWGGKCTTIGSKDRVEVL